MSKEESPNPKARYTYEYEIELDSDTAPARVLRMVQPRSRVLEIGAGPGSITKRLIGTLECDVVALEVEATAIAKLREFCPKVYDMDLNDEGWVAALLKNEGCFDYVIAADVLEHVYDPWKVLGGMRELLTPTGSVILSLPHVGHAAVLGCLVDEDMQYGPWGLLDRTHIRFFGLKNIQSLYRSQGMAIEDAQFVVRTPEMTEFAERWRRLPKDVCVALQCNRFAHVYQVVTRAVPVERAARDLDLMGQAVEPADKETERGWIETMASLPSDPTIDRRTTIPSLDVPEALAVSTLSELDALRRKITAIDRSIGELPRVLVDEISRHPRFTEQINLLERKIEEKETAVARYKAALSAIIIDANGVLRDKWWRRTKPLRRLSNSIRKLRGKKKKKWPTNFNEATYLGSPQVKVRRLDLIPTTGRDPISGLEYSPEIEAIEFSDVSEDFVPFRVSSNLETQPRTIAFYLPQFHPFSENDQWWGKGFTEWTNVGKARPLFEGHHQPHCPIHLGYYDLRLPEIMEEQARLARTYGVNGFAYYFYWFAGKVLMDRPLEGMLANARVDIPFCFIWANENWTRRWDGLESEVLIAQDHSLNDSRMLIRHLRRFFQDARYILVEGKPLFIVYRPGIIPDIADTLQMWREEAKAMGFPGLYLVSAQTFGHRDPREFGFDAAMDFPPHTVDTRDARASASQLDPNFSGGIYDYDTVVAKAVTRPREEYKVFPTAMLAWDNTARKGGRADIFTNFSVRRYSQWVSSNAERVAKDERLSGDERLLFINAWNEWAEGTHLEPDQRHGFGYLEATRKVMANYDLEDVRFHNPQLRERRSDVALVLHIHFLDVWPELAEQIRSLGTDKIDIYCTVTSAAAARAVNADFPDSFVELVDNRGRDIRPFLHLLRKLRPLNYIAIGKLHGKKSLHREDGPSLRRSAYQALLTKEAIDRMLADPSLGLLVPSASLVPHTSKNMLYNEKLTREIAERAGVEFKYGSFPAGSMFWFRPQSLDPLLTIGDNEFDVERGLLDGTRPHAIERLFGTVCESQGYAVAEI